MYDAVQESDARGEGRGQRLEVDVAQGEAAGNQGLPRLAADSRDLGSPQRLRRISPPTSSATSGRTPSSLRSLPRRRRNSSPRNRSSTRPGRVVPAPTAGLGQHLRRPAVPHHERQPGATRSDITCFPICPQQVLRHRPASATALPGYGLPRPDRWPNRVPRCGARWPLSLPDPAPWKPGCLTTRPASPEARERVVPPMTGIGPPGRSVPTGRRATITQCASPRCGRPGPRRPDVVRRISGKHPRRHGSPSGTCA